MMNFIWNILKHDRTGGFSFASVLLDEDDLSKVMQDKNVVDCEELTLAIMKVYILNIMTWQRMDLLIKGFTFFAQMYIV